jgi:endo-alpha-1,4-polygalactosaminidase (GH114 family)
MDGLIKIGMTSKDPLLRKSELETTGVPESFEIEYQALVDDYKKVEKKVHHSLEGERYSKEFFICTISEAITAIKSVATILYEQSNPNIRKDVDANNQQQNHQLEQLKRLEALRIEEVKIKAETLNLERVKQSIRVCKFCNTPDAFDDDGSHLLVCKVCKKTSLRPY